MVLGQSKENLGARVMALVDDLCSAYSSPVGSNVSWPPGTQIHILTYRQNTIIFLKKRMDAKKCLLSPKEGLTTLLQTD